MNTKIRKVQFPGRMIDESIRQESEKSDNSNQDDVDDEHQDVEFNFLPRQRARKYTNRPEILEDPEDSSSSEYTTEEDIYSDTLFNIAETATETLIKFMKLALCEFSSDDFNDFPDSLYLTRKKLGLNDQFHSFVPCPKCHKLYKKEEVVDFKQEDNPAIMKCQHIEFSNSSVRRSRLCNTALSEKISASTNRTIIRPNLMYPFAEINQQLATMFCRPGRENLLTLGILPGPKEVSLHKVNHYLAPIVNELETLWAGLTLNRTYECENGKRVRGALILVSCDIPAARKICGHVSALVSCHRCEKKANYENGQHNFAGMDDVGYSARDLNEHWQNALGWRRCNSDAARKRFIYYSRSNALLISGHCEVDSKTNLDRWGYFDTKFFEQNSEKDGRVSDTIRFGRIPEKIHSGEGFTNFTADQRILNHFVRVCSILVNRILESNLVDEAHRSLIEIVKLIENHHGRDKITPNLHLSLHLRDCSSDYGPLYAFWCFSFERMNGILGSLPNSNRKIESELMRRLMFDKQIKNIISSGIEVKGLELLNSQRTIGSLSVTDEFSLDEMHRFWLNSQNIKDSQISGKEGFPGEFLKLVSHNILLSSEMLNLMVEYYNVTYESFGFQRPLVEGLDNDIIIRHTFVDINTQIQPIFDTISAVMKFVMLSRFVPVSYQISNRQNAREYLAVNPISRKYQL
ncbi:hypothetical protein GLOIN_2v1775288 [Rhizophagus irregularis DAOM 181602=DAOM 197198]|nr:hypothetical protein GLOIN_2v1775288 [Rhizophagus irregularis DAOM 181602=DAOM 197198]